jgi:vitamin B12 transporter
MFKHCFRFFVLLAALVPSYVWAEKDTDKTDYQITVTADRLEEPVQSKSDSITVITHDQIVKNQWNYVLDAIRTVPGVAVVQSGSPGKVTSVFLRGAGSSQVLVLMDGVPINNPYFGGVDFENLTTDNVERIEVLKGPQSPLYGSDSIGGVIQIITRKGAGQPQLQTSFEGGTFQTYREKAGVLGAQGKMDYSVSFLRNDTDGQFHNDAFRENAFSGRGGYHWSQNTELTFTGNVFDSTTGIPFHTVYDPITFEPSLEASPLQQQDSNFTVLSAGVKHSNGKNLNLSTQFAYTRRDFSFTDPGSLFADSTNNSDVFNLNFQNDFQLSSSNTLTAGYEYERQNIDAQDNLNGVYPLKSVDENAVFVQNKFENTEWILTAGLRFDHYNTFGDTFNPRISAAYKITAAAKIRGSYGEGFRAPSAGDLGLPFYGNPNLKPEKSRSWEIGFDQSWKAHFFWSASWFHNSYDDLITFDPNTFIAGNIAKAMAQGLELSGTWSHGGWTFTGGYTYLDSEDKATGDPLPRRPKHSGNLQVGYDASRWGANLNVTAVGERFESDFLTSPTLNVFNPGYGKVDLAVRYQLLPSFRLKARIENLLDKKYEEALHYPALSRGFYAGIEWTL